MTQVMDKPTEITPYKPDAPVMYGKRDELAGLAARMRVMCDAKDAPDEVMYRAAQICMVHRLMPVEQVHVYQIGGHWVVDTGVDAWKLEAKRQAKKDGDICSIPTPRTMTPEEVKAERGEQYDPRDRGAVATLYLRSESLFHKEMGIPYEGHAAMGFWRVNARYVDEWKNKQKTGRKVWQSDTIPQGSTEQEVAQRRAIKKAIKQVFALDLDTASDEGYTISGAQLLEERIATDERERKDTRYTTVPNTQKVSEFTEAMLDAEPYIDAEKSGEDIEFQELQAALDKDFAQDNPKEPSPGTLLDYLYQCLTTEQREYVDLIYVGERVDDVRTTPTGVKPEDSLTQAGDGILDVLRTTVNQACGWDKAESAEGLSKADLLLCLMGGKYMTEEGVEIKLAAARQMFYDWVPEIQGKRNAKLKQARVEMMREAGKLLDETTK